jgi:5-hydroxyisourate hydrolase
VASISTHVLDQVRGRPAAGVTVVLDGPPGTIATGVTNADGRINQLADGLGPGSYQLTFDLAGYMDAPFFTGVVLRFEVGEERRYHVPLLAGPFSASTYLGS